MLIMIVTMVAKRNNKSKSNNVKMTHRVRAILIIGAVVSLSASGVYIYKKISPMPTLSLGSDFYITKHRLVKGIGIMPREEYCYATNVSPREFTTKLSGLEPTGYEDDDRGTIINYRESVRGLGTASYKTKEQLSNVQYDSNDFVCSDFKGMKYTVHMWDEDMWVIKPGNVDHSIRSAIEPHWD